MLDAGLLALGIVSGAISGLLGIGGATIIIPGLIYFFKMSQHQAQGTSLAVLLPPIGLLAFLEYHKHGHVELKMALIVAVGFLVGGLAGGYFAQWIPGHVLRKIFGIFLLIVAADMILR